MKKTLTPTFGGRAAVPHMSVFSIIRGGLVAAVALTLAVQSASANTVVLGNVNGSSAGSFTMGAGSTLNIAPASGISAPIAVTGAANGLIWQATSDPTQAANFLYLYNKVVSGFNGGGWDGTGITSGVTFQDANFGQGVLSVIAYDNTLLGFSKWQGVTMTDPNFRQTMLRVSYTGDLNGDGQVTADDFLQLIGYQGDVNTFKNGDLNGDGLITGDDFLSMIASQTQPYGNLGDATALVGGDGKGSASVVPEPASGLLLTLGTGILAGMRRKRMLVSANDAINSSIQ